VALGDNNNADSGFTNWSTGTMYTVSVTTDFNNNEYTVDFGGQTATGSFVNSASSVDTFGFDVDNFNGGSNAVSYIDDVVEL
jgi:hypothetical protein